MKQGVKQGWFWQLKNHQDLQHLSQHLPEDELVLLVSDCVIPAVKGRTLLVVTKSNLILYKNRERIDTFPLVYVKDVQIAPVDDLKSDVFVVSVVSKVTLAQVNYIVADMLPKLILPRQHTSPVTGVIPTPLQTAAPFITQVPTDIVNLLSSPSFITEDNGYESISSTNILDDDDIDDFLPPIGEVVADSVLVKDAMPSKASIRFMEEMEALEGKYERGSLSYDEYMKAKTQLLGF